MAFVERHKISAVVAQALKRRPGGVTASAQELIRILNRVELFLRGVRVAIRVRFGD